MNGRRSFLIVTELRDAVAEASTCFDCAVNLETQTRFEKRLNEEFRLETEAVEHILLLG
jgi:hypothetical protein